MEINIVKDSKNEVAKRREIEFTITQEDRTPSKADVSKELCKKLNLSPEATVVVKMGQEFGTRMTRAVAHSYQDADAMKKSEPDFLFERVVKKAKKAAAKAAEAPAAPAEEKKGEKKE